jgi:hypothetical protein
MSRRRSGAQTPVCRSPGAGLFVKTLAGALQQRADDARAPAGGLQLEDFKSCSPHSALRVLIGAVFPTPLGPVKIRSAARPRPFDARSLAISDQSRSRSSRPAKTADGGRPPVCKCCPASDVTQPILAYIARQVSESIGSGRTARSVAYVPPRGHLLGRPFRCVLVLSTIDAAAIGLGKWRPVAIAAARGEAVIQCPRYREGCRASAQAAFEAPRAAGGGAAAPP